MDVWPSTLPQEFDVGQFSVSGHDNFVRSKVDAGMPKRRRRYTVGLSTVEGRMTMWAAQIRTLQNFINSTLHGGVDQFLFPRPRYCSGSIAVVLKEPPKYDHLGGDLFRVTLTLETLEDYIA